MHRKAALGLTLMWILRKAIKPINAGILVRNVGTHYAGIAVLFRQNIQLLQWTKFTQYVPRVLLWYNALGTAISLLLGNGLIMNIYYHKMMKIDIIYFWHNILKFVPGIFISICLSLVIKFVIHGDNFLTFVLGLLITSLLTILGYWFLGMNDYEKGLVKKFLNKFRRSA